MISNKYIIKTREDQEMPLKNLQEIIGDVFFRSGLKVEIFDPTEIGCIEDVKSLNIAHIGYGTDFDSVIITKFDKKNDMYVDRLYSGYIPFYLLEVGIPRISSDSVPTKRKEARLKLYQNLKERLVTEIPIIEAVTFI